MVVKEMYFGSGVTLDGWNLMRAGVEEEVVLIGEVSGEDGGVRVAMLGVDFAVKSLFVDVKSLPTVWL